MRTPTPASEPLQPRHGPLLHAVFPPSPCPWQDCSHVTPPPVALWYSRSPPLQAPRYLNKAPQELGEQTFSLPHVNRLVQCPACHRPLMRVDPCCHGWCYSPRAVGNQGLQNKAHMTLTPGSSRCTDRPTGTACSQLHGAFLRLG